MIIGEARFLLHCMTWSVINLLTGYTDILYSDNVRITDDDANNDRI